MVVLATKLYVGGDARDRALDSLRSLVANELGDLDVEFDVGVRHDDFPSVTLAGDDAVVARNLLRETFGEALTDPTLPFEPGETYVGTLESWDDEGFVLDAGRPVRIPTADLGLGPGTPSQVRERFGLVQHVPLRFVVDGDDDAAADGEGEATVDGDAAGDGDESDHATGDDGANERGADASDVTGRLADAERDRLYDWTRGTGRLNVNSATRAEVRATLNRAGHAQDYVTVERLGLLEQSVVCAENTDPPGLLASVGSYLQAELRCVVP